MSNMPDDAVDPQHARLLAGWMEKCPLDEIRADQAFDVGSKDGWWHASAAEKASALVTAMARRLSPPGQG